nr:hypothetical protein [Streptococcus gallolyticus]
MSVRRHIYLDDERGKKLDEIVKYLAQSQGKVINKQRNKSETVSIIIDTFHELFVVYGDKQLYYDRLLQLENYPTVSDEAQLLKSIRRQLDRMLYLELTNFHAITKGERFDIQDLESIHSHFDPMQHELMARIEDVIKEDVSRGQTIKHSH